MSVISLTLTDGVTTYWDGAADNAIFSLNDDNFFALAAGGYRPQVATPKDTKLGGQWAWNDVVEDITLACLKPQVLEYLASLCTRARRFGRGDSVPPVKISYQVDSGQVHTSTILAMELILPSDWVDTRHSQGVIERMTIRILRRGLWLIVNNAAGVATFLAAGPCVSGVVLTNRSNGYGTYPLTPLSLELGPYTSVGSVIKPGVICITRECDDATKRGMFVADSQDRVSTSGLEVAAGTALGFDVIRLDPAEVILFNAVPVSFPLPPETRRIALFVSCKNGSAANTTVPSFYVQTVSSANNYVYESRLIVPAAANINTVQFCGYFDYSPFIDRIAVIAEGGIVDVDYIAVVRADDYGTHIIDFETNTPSIRNYSLSTGKIWIDNQQLATLAPRCTFLTAGGLQKTLAPAGDYALNVHDRFDILYLSHGPTTNDWAPANLPFNLRYNVAHPALGAF